MIGIGYPHRLVGGPVRPENVRVARIAGRPSMLTKLRRPFRGSAAVGAGVITWAQLRSAAWRRLYRDVYVDARVAVDHNLMIAGAVLLLPADAAIAGRSAAILWGAAEVTAVDRVEVVSPTQFGPVQGLSVRIGTIDRSEIDVHRGVRVTSSVHTAWDLARFRPMMEAVQWIDSLARVRRVGRSDLIAHGNQHVGARAVRRAAVTLRFCDPRAESPPESVLRINLHLDGVQVIPQFWVMVGNQFVARVDLAVPDISCRRSGVSWTALNDQGDNAPIRSRITASSP